MRVINIGFCSERSEIKEQPLWNLSSELHPALDISVMIIYLRFESRQNKVPLHR